MIKKFVSFTILLVTVSLSQAQIPLFNHHKKGFVDDNGKTIIPFEYDNVKEFRDSLAIVQKDNFWGVINKKNEVVIPFEYTDAESFSDGLAKVEKNGHKFFIDTTGRPVFYVDDYSYCEGFYHGLCKVGKNGMTGFIDVHGNLVIDTKYEIARTFNQGLSEAYGDGHWGAINTVGDTIIPFVYKQIWSNDGYYLVKKEGKWGILDNNNNVVIPIEYDYLDPFYEGLARAERNGKMGFIDKNNRVVIPFQYDGAYEFVNGLSVVYIGDKFGFIDKKNRRVVPLKYDVAKPFKPNNALADVSLNEKWGCVNSAGKVVIPVVYDDTTIVGDYVILRKNGKEGVYDKNGNVCIPFQYDWIRHYCGNLFSVGDGGLKSGIVNAQGQVIVPIE